MNYEGFKAEIYNLSGINLSLYKEKQMKRRIDSLIDRNGYSKYDVYLIALKKNEKLFNEFINHLTINVSEFYRNPDQWEVLKKSIYPHLLELSRVPKIWSTACSTGDEPYTLVMTLNEFLPLNEIKIIATDIDKEALRKAKEGNYTEKSLEKLPKNYIEKYFDKNGPIYTIKDEVKSRVEFSRLNMLKDRYPADCDLIVCRNVLIYFTDEAKAQIYTNFNKSLKKDGILFVGSTEQILIPAKYGLSSIKTFFYKKDVDMENG